MSKTVVIILSHGSRSKNSNLLTSKVSENLKTLLKSDVVFANLQLSPPYLEDVIMQTYNEGVRKFVIHPFFLHKGIHVEKDIPEEVDGFKSRYKDAKFVITPVTGDNPRITDIVGEIIKEYL